MILLLLLFTLQAYEPEHYFYEFKKVYPTSQKIVFSMVSNTALLSRVLPEYKDEAIVNNKKQIVALSDKSEILIDKDLWTKLSERCQRHIIYHELGHSVLNIMVHSDFGINNSKWDDIMQPTIDIKECMTNKKAENYLWGSRLHVQVK